MEQCPDWWGRKPDGGSNAEDAAKFIHDDEMVGHFRHNKEVEILLPRLNLALAENRLPFFDIRRLLLFFGKFSGKKQAFSDIRRLYLFFGNFSIKKQANGHVDGYTDIFDFLKLAGDADTSDLFQNLLHHGIWTILKKSATALDIPNTVQGKSRFSEDCDSPSDIELSK